MVQVRPYGASAYFDDDALALVVGRIYDVACDVADLGFGFRAGVKFAALDHQYAEEKREHSE